MKLLAISDVHVDPDKPGPWQEFAARAQDEQPDVLVLAGDLTLGKPASYETLLGQFGFFSGPKLFVPGNHDLWQLHSKRKTWDRYERELPAAVAAAGWHYLDFGPVLVGDVAFIGCTGWYDFSLRQRTAPRPGLRVSPGQLSAPGRGMKLFSARSRVLWEELGPDDYRTRAMQVSEESLSEGVVWNDAYYIDWQKSDEEMTRFFCDRLLAQARQISQARQTVAVTHFVPFLEALPDYTDVAPAYARAFAGSLALGETILSLPQAKVAIFGHWHLSGHWRIGGMDAYNVSARYGSREGTLISL